MVTIFFHEIYGAIVDGFIPNLGGGNSNIIGIFTPILGEDEPILTNIFQIYGAMVDGFIAIVGIILWTAISFHQI